MGSVIQSVLENKDESTDLVPLIDEQGGEFEEEHSTEISTCTVQDTKICSNDDVETPRFEQAIKNGQQQLNEGVEERAVNSVHLMAVCTSQNDKKGGNFEEEYSTEISTCTVQDINSKICSNDDLETSRFEQAIKNEQQQWNEGVEERVVDSLHLMAVCTSQKSNQEVMPFEDIETKPSLAQDKAIVLGQENEGESKLEVDMTAGDENNGQKIKMNEIVDLGQENKVEFNLLEVENVPVENEKEQEMMLSNEQISSEDFGHEVEETSEIKANMITATAESKKEAEAFDFVIDADRDCEDIDVGQENKEEFNESIVDDKKAQEIEISWYNEQVLSRENEEAFENETTENKKESFNFEGVAADTAGEDVCQENTEEQETKFIIDEQEMEIEDADENWEDLESCSDSDAVQETLSYMKMMLATKLPQRHESGGKEQSWREGTLIQRNLYALVTGYNSDFSFHIRRGDELWVFPCHVLPLSWASSKLEKMLEETNTHELLDVEPRYFLKLLEFIYADATTLDEIDTALGVWSVAHELDVQALASHCAFRARELVTAKDVCQALQFARRAGDLETEQFCIKYIREHTSAVLAADNWSKITRETLETILSQDELNCTSELELFQACVRWVTASSQDGNARDALGSVLGLIRFRNFSDRDFAIYVCPTKLLTDGEQSDIFCCLATNSAKMPAGFSSNIKSRGSCAVVKSSVSVAIGTSDFDDTSRPDSTLSTEYSQPEPSTNSNTEYNQLGFASWLNEEYNQPGCSASNVSYAETLRQSLVESYTGNGSDYNDGKKKDDVISLPVVQGKLEDLKNNGYLGVKEVITLRYTGEPEFVQDGHYLLNNPISFSVNISAYIMCVELFSWQNDKQLARYKESVSIILKSSNGKVVMKGKYEGNAFRQKIYRVHFYNPFCLTPNVTYKLYLQFNDLDILHCGYPIAKNRVYPTSWGLQVNILDASSSQLRGIQFGERT